MAWENIDVTRSGELLAGYPLPPLSAANLLNQRVAESGGRQNLGSKEFKNKIFGTKNLAACGFAHAAFTTTYFQDSNSAPYFETGAVKILTAAKYLSG